MMRCVIAVSVLVPLVIACGQPDSAARSAAPTPAPGAAVPAANVSPVVETPTTPAARRAEEQAGPTTKDGNGASHAHEAPHGGSLIELGEEFAHLELVLNAETGRLTVYALDGEAETPVRLAQPSIAMVVTMPNVLRPIDVTLEPVENALTGEKAGDTSQFVAIVPELKGRKAFRGTVTSLTLRGQLFSGVEFEFPSTEH
jgi:hypothetical protein